jgi:hypothetical protein
MGNAKKVTESKRDHLRKATAALFQTIDQQPRVTDVEWSEEGIEVRFDDGRKGLFPSDLLYANIPSSQSLP